VIHDAFNIVYFVSFFFLFLFSFLFIAIIIKKIRDVVLLNRLREEYLKVNSSTLLSPFLLSLPLTFFL